MVAHGPVQETALPLLVRVYRVIPRPSTRMVPSVELCPVCTTVPASVLEAAGGALLAAEELPPPDATTKPIAARAAAEGTPTVARRIRRLR
jgi:hypothetical protein